MGRAPCCDKANVKKGPWSPEEDAKLKDFIHKHGIAGNWISLPQKAGLKRCGKSCRLRWLNYLRPNIKHGEFSQEEDNIICNLYATIGSRWSIIAGQLAGRTDNDIKNYWNTKLKKKLLANLQPKPAAFSFPQIQSHLYNSLYYSATLDPIMNSTYPQSQNYFVCNYPDPMKDNNSNMVMFGGKEGSSNSSTSDVSCSYHQQQQEAGFRMIDDRVDYNQLQYDVDEIKALITAAANVNVNANSTSFSDNNNININSLVLSSTDHENKREQQGGVMYYY